MVFPMSAHYVFDVGRTPWSAAGPLAGLSGIDRPHNERVQGDTRGPGGPPH